MNCRGEIYNRAWDSAVAEEKVNNDERMNYIIFKCCKDGLLIRWTVNSLSLDNLIFTGLIWNPLRVLERKNCDLT